jgi:hypothetical protein
MTHLKKAHRLGLSFVFFLNPIVVDNYKEKLEKKKNYEAQFENNPMLKDKT